MNKFLNYPSMWRHPAGTVVRVNCGWYDHVGLLGEPRINSERSVLSFSAKCGGFVEQTLTQFSSGRTVVADGFPSGLHPDVVMRRARSLRGRDYSWLSFNCEHFVRFAHDLTVESPQLRNWLAVGGVAGLVALAMRA